MMWKKRGNDLDQSNGFVMLPLSDVVGFAKRFFVTRHEQVTLVTYSKFVIVNGIPDSRLLFQIGVVCTRVNIILTLCARSISERSIKKVIKLNCL